MKFIKKLILYFLAIFMPFVVLFIQKKPSEAVMAIVLQASLIGFPIAIFLAFKSLRAHKEQQKEPLTK